MWLFVSFVMVVIAIIIIVVFVDERSHLSDIEALEDDVIYELYGNSIKSVWKNIQVKTLHGDSETWLTHYLEPSFKVNEKPDLLLLHGYGATSAFTWRVTIPKFTNKFNVYAIDMPGFGRTAAPKSLMDTDMQDTHDAYCQFYHSSIVQIGMRKPYVIAHSFGGFVFTQCAAQNPKLISKLVLVSVPGIFPSNGGLDFLWSNYFYLGLPQNCLRMLGDWAHHIYDLAVFLTDSKLQYHTIRYWHLYHTHENAMVSDYMVRKFIKHYVYYSIGRATSLVPLLKLGSKVPVVTIYGSNDVIVPYEQGELIQNISFNRIKAFIIDGANHVTYLHDGGDIFSKIVHDFFNDEYGLDMKDFQDSPDRGEVLGTENYLPLVASCLEEHAIDWNTYPCVPSYIMSNRLQQQMHSAIYNILEKKCGLLSTATRE